MDAVAKRRIRIAAIIAAVVAGIAFRYFFPKYGMHGESAASQNARAEEEARIAREFPSQPWTAPPGGNPGGTNFNGIIDKSKAILDGKVQPPEPVEKAK